MRYWLISFVFILSAAQASVAIPGTLRDLLRSEKESGNKHIDPALQNWFFAVAPEEIMFADINISAERRELNAALDKLRGHEAELSKAERSLASQIDEVESMGPEYESTLRALGQSSAVLTVDKAQIPDFLRRLEETQGKDSLQYKVYQPWLSMIEKEAPIPELGELDNEVLDAWKVVAERTRGEISNARVVQAIDSLSQKLTGLVARICQLGEKTKLCGDGSDAALESLWNSEMAKLSANSSGFWASTKSTVSGWFWKADPLMTKLIRHLTEQRVIQPEKNVIARYEEATVKLSRLAERVDRLKKNVRGSKRVFDDKARNMIPSIQKWNLANHRLYTLFLGHLSDKIREGVAANASNVTLEMKDGNQSVSLANLRLAFVAVMHALEKFEFAAVDELGEEDPYPAVDRTFRQWVEEHFNPFAEPTYLYVRRIYEAPTSGEKPPHDSKIRETKKEIMWNYYLAQHGLKSTRELYEKVGSEVRDRLKNPGLYVDAKGFLNQFTASNVISFIGNFKQFSDDYPVLAIDLSRNLRHSYEILFPKSQFELVNSVQRIYSIKEAENVARDWLLGELEHVYTSEAAKAPPSLSALFFVDFANRAPYLCAIAQGVNGNGLISSWTQAFLGTGLTGKVAGGLAGALQVKGEKELAARISREHELSASILRRAFTNYLEGKSAKDIAISAGAYYAGRQLVQGIGTTRNLAAKGMLLEEAKACAKQNAREGVLGSLAATPFAILAGAAATAFGVGALPVLVVGGVITLCGVGTMAIVDRVSGRRARRLSEVNRKFLDRFVLPEIKEASVREKFLKAAKPSDAQIDDIVSQTVDIRDQGQKDAKQLELYKKIVDENLKTDEETSLKAGFKDVQLPNSEVAQLEAEWSKLERDGLGVAERTSIAQNVLDGLPASEKRNEGEQRIAQKIAEFQAYVKSASASEDEVAARATDIRQEIHVQPFREMKDAMVKMVQQ